MTIRKLAGLSAFTLFAAASLCAENSAGTETGNTENTDTETSSLLVKAEDFYDNIAEEDRRTDILTEEEIVANRPRDD